MKNVSGIKMALVLYPHPQNFFFFLIYGSLSYKSIMDTELRFIH